MPPLFKFETQPLPFAGGDDTATHLRFSPGYGIYAARIQLKNTEAADVDNYGLIMVAHVPLFLIEARCRFAVAGTDASAVTCDLEKLPNGTAKGAGSTMLRSTFNLKGTVNTVQTIYPKQTDLSHTQLAIGEGCALKLAGTPTAVNDLVVDILWGFLYKEIPN